MPGERTGASTATGELAMINDPSLVARSALAIGLVRRFDFLDDGMSMPRFIELVQNVSPVCPQADIKPTKA